MCTSSRGSNCAGRCWELGVCGGGRSALEAEGWESPSAGTLLRLPQGSACSQVPCAQAARVLLLPSQAYPLSCHPAFSLPARRILLTGRHHPQRPQPPRKPPRDPSQRGHRPQDTASRSSSARYQLGASRLPGPGPRHGSLRLPLGHFESGAVWAAALRCWKGGTQVVQLGGLTGTSSRSNGWCI